MMASLVRGVRSHPRAVLRLAIVVAGFALARSQAGAVLKALGFAASAVAALAAARRAEAVLRQTEERLRSERSRRP